MREAEAYPQLYQESSARKTKDKAINILQGRCVGGGTTVNWTSSFRTPAPTLEHWATRIRHRGIRRRRSRTVVRAHGSSASASRPGRSRRTRTTTRCAAGASVLGIASGAIRRNVKGCWNLGYCGMGCPTNAKQSMLVTTIPAALARGATLVTRARALDDRAWQRSRVDASLCRHGSRGGTDPTARKITVRARDVHRRRRAPSASPALLLRSRALTRTASSASARSCIRRWSRQR